MADIINEETFEAVKSEKGSSGRKKEDVLIPVVLFFILGGLAAGIFALNRGISRRSQVLQQRSPMTSRGSPPPVQAPQRSQPLPLPSVSGTPASGPRSGPGPADRTGTGPVTERPPQVPEGMVYVPAGELVTGRGPDGAPLTVEVAAFFIDRFEVTNRQYHEFIRATNREPPRDVRGPEHSIWRGGVYPAELADHPVVNVSFQDAAAYAAWAGKRLPTEREWARAARGSAETPFPWGANADPSLANFSDNPATHGTLPVGSFPSDASPLGVFDMAGNVREWTDTPFDANDRYTKVIMGGSFADRAAESSTFRRRRSSLPRHDTGFRCALSVR